MLTFVQEWKSLSQNVEWPLLVQLHGSRTKLSDLYSSTQTTFLQVFKIFGTILGDCSVGLFQCENSIVIRLFNKLQNYVL